jgi:hypothetical protein
MIGGLASNMVVLAQALISRRHVAAADLSADPVTSMILSANRSTALSFENRTALDVGTNTAVPAVFRRPRRVHASLMCINCKAGRVA